MIEVDYDSTHDILYLYKKGEKAKFSIEVKNFVIDVADNNKIVGLDIFNASKILDK